MPAVPLDLLLFCSFCFFILVQILYYLLLFARLAFYRKPSLPVEDPHIPVSIIVCAFNEEANLLKNLPLLLGQDYHRHGKPLFEVLVVNHNSEDDTFYILNRMKEEYPHLSVLHLTQDAKLIPGKKFPLSMGIKQARHEHLLLTDADCRPAGKQWLAWMASGFNEGKQVVLGYSPYVHYPGRLNRDIRFETAHAAMQYLSYAMVGMPYMGVGRNLAYVKELFNRNKGFSSHNHITSGDDDLFINQVATAQNTKVMVHEESFTFSEPKRTREEWLFQKSRHLSTGKFYRPKHKFFLGMYAFSHFAIWALLLPVCLFPAFWIPAAAVFLLRSGVQWFIFSRCFRVLGARGLNSWIPFYDVWYLLYNIRNIPAIFFKTQKNWK